MQFELDAPIRIHNFWGTSRGVFTLRVSLHAAGQRELAGYRIEQPTKIRTPHSRGSVGMPQM